MIHLLQREIKRSIFSRGFVVGVLGITALLLIAIGGLLTDESYLSVWYFMGLALQGSGMASTILTILPTFAYGLSYAKEVEENAITLFVIRTGVTKYSLTKILVSAITGFLIVFLGLTLFLLVLRLRYPFFISPSSEGPYDLLVNQGEILKGVLFYLTHQGLVGAFVAVSGVCFSSFVPNVFTTAAAPMIIYFSLLRITTNISLPMMIDPLYWIAAVYEGMSAVQSLLTKVLVITLLCLPLGAMTMWRIKRRLLNG